MDVDWTKRQFKLLGGDEFNKSEDILKISHSCWKEIRLSDCPGVVCTRQWFWAVFSSFCLETTSVKQLYTSLVKSGDQLNRVGQDWPDLKTR